MAERNLQNTVLTPSSLSETKTVFLLCLETVSQIKPPKSLPMCMLSRSFPGTVSWKMEDSSKQSDPVLYREKSLHFQLKLFGPGFLV